MAALSCKYSKCVGGECGASVFNETNIQCLRIADCNKNIKEHLKLFDVRDSTIDSEGTLLLARAGISLT